MSKGIIIAACLAVVGFCSACSVSAQTTADRQKDLVAQLDKTKTKVKDKGAVHVSAFVDIRNEAAVKKPAEQSGTYVGEMPNTYQMDLNVAADGTATATGYDTVGGVAGRWAKYTFTGRVDGALLTGTRTFEDGSRQPFEAVFVNETTRSGSTEADATVTHTAFGVGYILQGDQWRSRVFLEKK